MIPRLDLGKPRTLTIWCILDLKWSIWCYKIIWITVFLKLLIFFDGIFLNPYRLPKLESICPERHVMSCRVVSCRVVSCRVVSCRVVSCRAVPCRAVPCHVMSCHATPRHVTSPQVTSRHVMHRQNRMWECAHNQDTTSHPGYNMLEVCDTNVHSI